MRKVGFLFLFSYLSAAGQVAEKHIPTSEHDKSSTSAIVIGLVILIVVIFVLYRRQKRKFND